MSFFFFFLQLGIKNTEYLYLLKNLPIPEWMFGDVLSEADSDGAHGLHRFHCYLRVLEISFASLMSERRLSFLNFKNSLRSQIKCCITFHT